MGNAIIINNSEPREIKAKLNYARKKLFEFTGPTLNIIITCLVLVLVADYTTLALTILGPIFTTIQSRWICIILLLANSIIALIHFNPSRKFKNCQVFVIMLSFVILFSYSTYFSHSLSFQTKEIHNEHAATIVKTPFEYAKLDTGFNPFKDKFNNLTCCGFNYIEFYRGGSTYSLIPKNFLMLPDACCSEFIFFAGSYPGETCDTAINICFLRKVIATVIPVFNGFLALSFYFDSVVWLLVCTLIFTNTDQNIVDLQMSNVP